MLRLQRSTLPPDQVRERFQRWRLLGYGRLALGLVAWLLALKALTFMG